MKTSNILIIALGLVLSACSSKAEPTDSAIGVRIKENGKWSLYQSNGSIKYRNELQYQPGALTDGYFLMAENNGFSLYRADTRPVRVPNASDLYSAGVMHDGMIPVAMKNSRITVIDGDGETLFTLDTCDGHEIVKCGTYVNDGMLNVINDEGLHGYISTGGVYVIKPGYVMATPFTDGVAAVTSRDDGKDHAFIIDTQGKEKHRFPEGTILTPFTADGCFIISDNSGKFYVVDDEGETVLGVTAEAQAVTAFGDDYIVYTDASGKYGVTDMDGNQLIKADCQLIVPVFDGKFLVTDAQGHKYIADDKGGKETDMDQFAEVSVPQPLNTRYVESGHYDASPINRYISGIVNADGLGDYTFGQLPRFNFVNPFEYAGSKEGRISKFSGKLYGYDLDARAVFNKVMAVKKGGKDVWNNDARLTGFIIDIDATKPQTADDAIDMAKSLQRNGFAETDRKQDKNGVTVTLRNGETVATVSLRASRPERITVSLRKA